jgi:hypothetical protein
VPATDAAKLGPGRIIATIVLALVALACFGETGKYLLSQHHHTVRIVGSFVLGLVLAIGAWFALRYQSLAAEEAREAERIAAARAATDDAVATVDSVAAVETASVETAAVETAAVETAAVETAAVETVGAGQQAAAATQA